MVVDWRASETLCTECKFVIYICIFGRMSPLLIARAPYDVKGAELGHSHFYRMASIQNVGGVKNQRWILAQRKHALLTTVVKVSQLYT